ncbi:MmgE/PrpD family protein [Glutamicibacter sp.]|uniref:MmgE/PrpD family protein n=1 Tax=Glutamicibacter sp. TaxID=1931995 RepID=UPI002B49A5C1|nr:MmgE/PrpD family protein [Glutamicibacter sp.]HJX78828.1 MmgE/PrpD family protein [Glutamicibacter sp.]
MPKSIIDQLVDHALDTSIDNFDAEDIMAAKMRLIDAWGCMVSGAGGDGIEAVLNVVRPLGSAPQASLAASHEKLALPYAAMINSLQTRNFDFEVCGPEPEGSNAGKMVGHVGSSTEPVAFNVGEFMHSSGKELLEAVVIGGDIAARFSVGNTFNFNADFEVCGTSNAFGSTVVAARLLGLDKDQLRNAFGILLNLMAGSYQSLWDGVPTFKLPGAMAAYNGIFAAQLSKSGLVGVRDAIESRLGFLHLYAPAPQPDSIVADLGETFYVRGQHKMHPSCYGNHNAIDCAIQLRNEHNFSYEDIDEVYVDVLPTRIDHFLNQHPTADDEQPKFLFSIPYSVATTLLRGRPELAHYATPEIYEEKVLDLTHRVTLRPALPAGKTHACNVVVRLKDGTEISVFRDSPVGWLDDPVTYADVVDKFWRNISYNGSIPREQAENLLAAIEDLENVADVAELTKQLTLNPQTSNATSAAAL